MFCIVLRHLLFTLCYAAFVLYHESSEPKACHVLPWHSSKPLPAPWPLPSWHEVCEYSCFLKTSCLAAVAKSVSLELCMYFQGTARPFGSTKPFGLFPTLWAAAAVWWLNTPQSCWGPHSTFKHPSEALSQAKERIGSGSRGFGLSGCLAPAPKPQRGKGSKLCNHVQPSIFQSSAEICPANSS